MRPAYRQQYAMNSNMLRACVFTFVAMATVQAPRHITAQVPQFRILGAPTCANCVIKKELVRRITDRTLPGALLEYASAHVARDGRSFVVSGEDGRELYLADANGQIVRRIGRSGEGPNEYRAPNYVLELDSFFVVFDTRNSRATYLAKQDLRAVKSVRLTANPLIAPIPLPMNRYAANVVKLSSGQAASKPISVIAASGTTIRSFGLDTRKGQSITSKALTRILAPGRGGVIWAGYPEEYRIEKWDTAGQLLAVYQREVEWFRPRDSNSRESGLPHLRSLHEDENGALWVTIGTVKPNPAAKRGAFPFDHSLSETRVEVLDMSARRVIASQTFPSWFPQDVMGGLFQTIYTTTEGGDPLVQVWTYTLSR
jgi:hypothetical protein